MSEEGCGYTSPIERAALDKYLPMITWAIQTSVTAMLGDFAFTQYCRKREFEKLRGDLKLGKNAELVLLGWKDEDSALGAFADGYLPNVQAFNLAMETCLDTYTDDVTRFIGTNMNEL